MVRFLRFLFVPTLLNAFAAGARRFAPSLVALVPLAASAAEPVRFGRDVLPILSANCFTCHGPDEGDRKAKLRLDLEADAKRERDDGPAIAPGQPERSNILTRLTSTDPDEVMPPPDAHKTVKPEQIETLRRWIAEGATWGRHWAFEPVVRPDISPAARRHPIDLLVDAELTRSKIPRPPRAAPHVLARRLSLDLIGLPPTPEAADTFAADPSPAAYERMVDELLQSPQFGEHWARLWLDLARYADTKGYEKDLGRTMWPYRDWVVNALNADMSLDRFTAEQLAGDLLPEPTEQQIIATAFHRNTMTNDEAGTDDEEFRVAAVKDRADTTVQVWMGLTMGCAKCHTHKYDPISQKEYYSFYAIFNQTADTDKQSDEPLHSKATPQQQAALDAARQKQKSLDGRVVEARNANPKLAKSNQPDSDDPPELVALKQELKAAQTELKEINETILSVPIMRELAAGKRRETRLHLRGNFLDSGEVVSPAVLSAIGKLPDDAKPDRLGVARWLVSADNPLTPRVWANRVWARLFGVGIVETEEDFGALGSPPTHPELLDWLAAEYRDRGWSLKKLIRTIVVSDTYRQASEIAPAARDADPRNLLLARGARFRLGAEAVRDQALAVSGLLSLKMGGPPAMPPQPAGLWRTIYNSKTWVDSGGEDRFRRGLYTYLKRTTPYPSMTTFDAGTGEVCQVRRIRTNTPLQALVTLNDPVYLEAAAALAARMVAEARGDEARAARGLRLALIRPLHADESAPLVRLQKDAHAAFDVAPEKAAALLASTRAVAPAGLSPAEFAAWVVVANAILNLDEFLNRN